MALSIVRWVRGLCSLLDMERRAHIIEAHLAAILCYSLSSCSVLLGSDQ